MAIKKLKIIKKIEYYKYLIIAIYLKYITIIVTMLTTKLLQTNDETKETENLIDTSIPINIYLTDRHEYLHKCINTYCADVNHKRKLTFNICNNINETNVNMFHQDINILLITYDASNINSFHRAIRILNYINRYKYKFITILFGTITNIKSKMVSTQEGICFAKYSNVPFFECNFSKQDMDEVFTNLIDMYLVKYDNEIDLNRLIFQDEPKHLFLKRMESQLVNYNNSKIIEINKKIKRQKMIRWFKKLFCCKWFCCK
jgi:hypothetical protein